MKKQFYKWIFFKLMGWKIVGTIDPNIKKCVMMVMPHTSAHDFYLGIFTRGITGLEMNWGGKKELFRFPFGFYFRYMGGEPLDRTGGLNKVDSIAAIFQRKEVFRLAVAPEGTRKKVAELKTGFYYIALKVNVPIIPVAFDFGQKEVNLGTPLMPSGNIEADMTILKKHYIGVEGKIPEKGYKE
ncbi:1-acyl-sn-glycerol-3-phosphate acyltransferase [Flavobacterium gawalongense]|uniref:Acyltransferase n=1 Tax=Flavobacterium gawalongense TaxID=2594432 RepID=A0A553BG66_9FLAO|nr:1-acyl-sn-glycerol-3-phosphate acyltransferase [Flavobacterium gawalongense]TRW99899.1 acyltransferase [Flavobacterium gawalongense]TRX04363.1 acyltransferase [Flavobacterium gawalongense]TRX07248.1 acyltransferase [Flavobacterium gawalongense]TRX07999.1 acyltransferase [Flavobacterium gawalongense]TRX24251.1 acyltransferase [Flavobacterium gawalongense]